MLTTKQFINTLEDDVNKHGAPEMLISDSATYETSTRVKDYLRSLFISSWQSEPDKQNQNLAERHIQSTMRCVNVIMDRTGASTNTWFLCVCYVCYLLNHTFNNQTGGIPAQALTSVTQDISPLLRFHFWEEVYYKEEETSFPSDSPEAIGNIVGIAEHVGHKMTYQILTKDTLKIMCRSEIRSVKTGINRRVDLLSGEDFETTPVKTKFVKTRMEYYQDGELDPGDLVLSNHQDICH